MAQSLQTGSEFWQLVSTRQTANLGKSRVVYSSIKVLYLQQTQGIGSRHRFAVPHQEAAISPSMGQQLFGLYAADVPMVPCRCCHGAFKSVLAESNFQKTGVNLSGWIQVRWKISCCWSPVMLKPEVHTVIPSLSETEHAKSDPAALQPQKAFLFTLTNTFALPWAGCVFGQRADPGPASSSCELFWLHLWELMTERPYTCCPPADKSSLLSGSEHCLCKCFQEEEPKVKKSTSSRSCRPEKAVE